MGRSGELALTFESSERVASSAEATGGGELFSPLAHTRVAVEALAGQGSSARTCE